MGKKQPNIFEWLGLFLASQVSWDDDEWERWEEEMYRDNPTAPPPFISIEGTNIVVHPLGKAAAEDWINARTARLASGFVKLGMTCYDVGLGLRELLEYEDRAVEVMLPALLTILRARGTFLRHGGVGGIGWRPLT
jgi:hypothetical protein